MDVVQFFGNIIAKKTGLKRMVCSGMIRLALRDMKNDPEMYDIRKVKILIKEFINNRLERAGIENKNELIHLLLLELSKNQSLLTMSADSKD
ncbi:MAG: hypothetical protein ACFFAS_16265 [Promethearchaeota archaeon]